MKRLNGTCRDRRSLRAFTFLEIMFVVVIIGILLAVALPRFSGQTNQARMQATRLQMGNIRTALSQFEMHVGRYPDTREGLQALVVRPSNVSEQLWEGPYLDAEGGQLPTDAWKNPFNYRSPGEHNKDYDLWSAGPDGREGTEDDITNWGSNK
jgi:general secretion pathway protein G